jgi:hypothetical protein
MSEQGPMPPCAISELLTASELARAEASNCSAAGAAPSDAVDGKPAIDDQFGSGDVLGLVGRKE